MAKKQQIILTHGSAIPSADVIKGLKLGEVLVQHAADAKEVALHTVNKEGDSATLISFPSKEWVQDKIDSVDAAGIGNKITTIEGRLDAIEEDYLTSDDKTNLEGKVTEEATARANADAAIEEKIGGEYTKTNTVAMAIAKEAQDRTTAINGIQATIDALGNTYATDAELASVKTELEDEIAKAKTALTEAADVTAGVKVVKTTGTDGHDNYEITAVGLATTSELNAVKGRLDTIEGEANVEGSMKNIAAAEVAKIVDDAPEAFDTLKEIAEWIGSDTTGAAGMTTDINNLKSTLTGFNTTDTVQKTTNAIEGRLDTIEDDYLKAADKTELEGKVTEETTARANADTAIEEKIGGEYTKTNTVAMAIAKEAQDRTTAINGIQATIDALGNTYATDAELASVKTELEDGIAKAKTTLAEAADVTAGVKVVKTTDTDGHDNYEITAVGLTTTGQLGAVDTRVGTVEANYIKEVVVKDKDGEIVKTYSPVNNVLDLTDLIIDGGEY